MSLARALIKLARRVFEGKSVLLTDGSLSLASAHRDIQNKSQFSLRIFFLCAPAGCPGVVKKHKC
jgi:transposase-like protein